MAGTQTLPKELQYQFELQGSLLEFTRVFYYLRTGRTFDLSQPIGRESHIITICRALMRVFNGECNRLIINVPPRYGKTELLIHFVAWAMANHPDSNFIYTSYSTSLATKQTQTIKQIMTSPHYRKLFGVDLKDDTQAKNNFETTKNGSVYAVGAGGTITGRGAGLHGVKRFGGAFIMDDMHKPSEVTSDTIREAVIDWYFNTAMSRANSADTPFIFIGQRLHEDDLPARLIKNGSWEIISLPALDLAGNALNPEKHTPAQLLEMQELSPYVFAAQYQQNPQPAGGGIFKPEWFALLDEEPEILATVITADTAETAKDYNDATVFHFLGVYQLPTGVLALHSIDCREIRVEPKDLEAEFLDFYSDCTRHKVPPLVALIENKSTGVTLSSVLKTFRGLKIRQIERTKASGSKTARFLEMQPFIAAGLFSLPKEGKHTPVVLEHMRKITANDSHRHDDIADTIYDAIKVALIDKTLYIISQAQDARKAITSKLNQAVKQKVNALQGRSKLRHGNR